MFEIEYSNPIFKLGDLKYTDIAWWFDVRPREIVQVHVVHEF